jgi:glycosyltransferase involved in cell wall biosynthesis
MKHLKEPCVVYIITQLELGGAQKVCLSLFNHVTHHGIQTKLISSNTGILVNTIKDSPHAILLSTLHRTISIASIIHEIRTFFTLIRKLRTLKKQYPHIIVHTHSTKAGILGRWAGLCAGVKKRIHTVHGYAFHAHQSWPKWLAVYAIELITSLITTHFVCVSSEDVKTGIRLFPRFAKRHSIIRAAVAWEQFYTPARITNTYPDVHTQFIFGTVSCFKPQKNIFDLLHAFQRVHRKNSKTRLEIIGDGALRPQIEQWITHHNLTHAITLHGWQHTIAPIMITWHAFALSSLWEGLPCAVVEARLLKLPIVSYKTGGIGDIIFEGENGMLCPQKNWYQLSKNMHELTINKKLYEQLSQYSENLQDFSITSMVQQHANLYHQLL